MAKNQAKRSIPSAQPRRRARTAQPGIRPRGLFRFAQAKGKTLEEVGFSTSPGYHCISVNFQDRTSLNFEIETGFTVEAEYSHWKTGNQRVLRNWRPMRSQ